MRLGWGWMTPAAVLCASCGPAAPISPCGVPDATCPLEAGLDAIVHTPQNHRASAAACPGQRGPGSISVACNYDAGPPVACLHDTDCTAGKNGRCLDAPPVACATVCSYDTCFADTDCDVGLHVACDCRASPSDSTANRCAAGNCRLDADCSAGGFCSRSACAGSVSYFCHTPNDTCIDDGDCPINQSCSYDTQTAAWSCTSTCTPPL